MTSTTTTPQTGRRAPKVPDATVSFWVAKVATTAFGEAFSDFVFFDDAIGQHPAILMALGLLTVCLVGQLLTRRYTPSVYWAAVTAVSIFGTMSADFLNIDLGLPVWLTTAMLLILQAAVFVLWFRTQRTLDVHRVDRPARETFYWATVILTFALGTAAGDFASMTLGLGSLAASAVFLALIVLLAAGHRRFRWNPVATFWIAYTFTRPAGASLSDWLGVPAPYGDGLQLGTGPMSVVFGALLLAVVTTTAVRHRRAVRTGPHASPADASAAGR